MRFYTRTIALALIAIPVPAVAQSSRADLSGPFVVAGASVGSLTTESGPTGTDDSGYGWGAGAGYGLRNLVAVVGEYLILRVGDASAGEYDLEQSALGVRLRFGGGSSSGVFMLEGGGAWRRASFPTATAFATNPPAGAGALVPVEGLAGWFGPGLQWYWERRLAVEVTVAWAWGNFSHARVSGERIQLTDPIGITTLRLRAGVAATLF
jgi:hypothetical protein